MTQEQVKPMKCPLCDEAKDLAVRVDRAPMVQGDFGPIISCVAYVCTKCGGILSLESNPSQRDGRLQSIDNRLEALEKLMAQEQKKSAGRAMLNLSGKKE